MYTASAVRQDVFILHSCSIGENMLLNFSYYAFLLLLLTINGAIKCDLFRFFCHRFPWVCLLLNSNDASQEREKDQKVNIEWI